MVIELFVIFRSSCKSLQILLQLDLIHTRKRLVSILTMKYIIQSVFAVIFTALLGVFAHASDIKLPQLALNHNLIFNTGTIRAEVNYAIVPAQTVHDFIVVDGVSRFVDDEFVSQITQDTRTVIQNRLFEQKRETGRTDLVAIPIDMKRELLVTIGDGGQSIPSGRRVVVLGTRAKFPNETVVIEADDYTKKPDQVELAPH